jgi:hypothetical protein
MRIRQIAMVARALEPVVTQLCDALQVEVCYRDPGVGVFGLHNALLAIGDTFLEVVSPHTDGTTAGRFLERRGGDGGYMVLFETQQLATDRARIDAAGVRVVWEIALDDIAAIHLHPRDVGGAIVSLDQPKPAGAWRWAGPRWPSLTRAGRASSVVGLEVAAEDPARMAGRWAQVLGLGAPEALEGGRYRLALAGGEARFAPVRDARGEGLTTLDLRARPGQSLTELDCCGLRFRVRSLP